MRRTQSTVRISFAATPIVDAFAALGGTADLKGTISKEKIVSVLLHEFELTLDVGKYMQNLGEDVKELNYDQFCTLLNETRSTNPSRYSSFLGRRQMSGAVQFFDQLEEQDGEIIIDEEDEKEKAEREAGEPAAH